MLDWLLESKVMMTVNLILIVVCYVHHAPMLSPGTFAAVGLLKKMRWASEVLGPGVMQAAAVAHWSEEGRAHLMQMLADNLPR
jgi:hypothetical protein